MKKISLKGLDMEVYEESFDNGLKIYMLPYENKKNYFISYTTRFGSDVLEYTDSKDKNHKPPLGIAHFLEHKMFEQESGEEPFAFFSKSGTDSNASTTFDSTEYICYGTKEFEKNLEYLLRFVNEPYYTDENVNKEKGIIAEEINMYNDIPDFQLEMRLRECLYKNHPRRIDIAGTVEEIEKITKEDLYSCYENFYVPNNMFLLIVGNFSVDKAMTIIRNELEEKKKVSLPKIKKIIEPKKVNIKEDTIYSNIEIPKLSLGLKIPTENLSLKGLELDLYLHMLTTILFGASSYFREKVRNDKIMSDIYMDWEEIEDFRTFYLTASSMNPTTLRKEIEKVFQKIIIHEEDFERIKKVWIADEVRMIDNVEAAVSSLFIDIINYKEVIPNRIELIRKMKLKKLKDLVHEIDFQNTSIVTMLAK